MCYAIMNLADPGSTMATDLFTMQLADAQQRIKQTEFALVLSEKMVAENLALSSRIRSARRRVLKTGGPLATVDSTS
ncbi:hypothetical protein X771_03315 [Mesorhizobium sp. LSJC277A00]|nr:hypothetical protein X771_03315 [Mesorhizobium sp. LSJC277A00]ESX23295.1 hypothetical protein X767_15365 [Mesorhizobium sp. LSJC264A00]ESY10558.1 hypothetical protein X752_16340 [Mesorhizobium sp. LNJC398B00]ESY36618.1 hypothetical protein X748_12905 [Mesorhizobium sp. LNJC386A00]ESY49557.1 hypothetical protein X746_04735 [Mesorhizobium sp. LNJC380A00]